MLESALASAKAARDADLEDLFEELRIPSVSTLPEHRPDCLRNADWLRERFASLGFDTELVEVFPTGLPVLRADWTGRPGAGVVTLYGHYDVQPPDPLEEWRTEPFGPTVRDGEVYARGVADNKANHMAALKAAEHWMAAGGPPVNVRFLIEGEEEIGGESLPAYIRREASSLRTDHVVLWDAGFTADDQPVLCVGLRGMLYMQMEVRGPSHDLHSGAFGGVAPNPCAELARILASAHDDAGRVTIPGFYDDVAEADPAETARWHRPPDREAAMKRLIGTDALVGEQGYDVDERLWVRPTFEVNGMWGGFTGEGAKTIVPARASAKVSMRLVPHQDASKLAEAVGRWLTEQARPGFDVGVRTVTSAPAVVTGYEHEGARALSAAFETVFGRRCVLVRSGGSIPVAAAFADTLEADMVVSGISHTGSGAHSPNEHLAVESYLGGIEVLIRYLGRLGGVDA